MVAALCLSSSLGLRRRVFRWRGTSSGPLSDRPERPCPWRTVGACSRDNPPPPRHFPIFDNSIPHKIRPVHANFSHFCFRISYAEWPGICCALGCSSLSSFPQPRSSLRLLSGSVVNCAVVRPFAVPQKACRSPYPPAKANRPIPSIPPRAVSLTDLGQLSPYVRLRERLATSPPSWLTHAVPCLAPAPFVSPCMFRNAEHPPRFPC